MLVEVWRYTGGTSFYYFFLLDEAFPLNIDPLILDITVAAMQRLHYCNPR